MRQKYSQKVLQTFLPACHLGRLAISKETGFAIVARYFFSRQILAPDLSQPTCQSQVMHELVSKVRFIQEIIFRTNYCTREQIVNPLSRSPYCIVNSFYQGFSKNAEVADEDKRYGRAGLLENVFLVLALNRPLTCLRHCNLIFYRGTVDFGGGEVQRSKDGSR